MTMSNATHTINLEPIVSAPTDGRAFEAILGDAPNRIEVVKFENGRWKVYRGGVPSPTPGATREMEVWQHLPDGVYPTLWIKASLEKITNGARMTEGKS